MADWNLSRDVNGDRGHSGGTSRPPLPPPDNGDNVRPVPLWEREFCRNAYDIPWETFCENKRFIGLYKNVMDWDDSGGLKNFLDAKERFRAKYFGEPYEDPVLDPDMYIDEVDHHCKVDPELVADLDKVAGLDLVADLGWGGMANLAPTGWGEPFPNLTPTGWGEPANPTPDAAWGGQGNQTPEAVRGAHPYSTPNNSNNNLHGGGPSNNRHQQGVDPGHTSSGTARMLPGGGRIWISGISSGGAMKWNGGGGGGNGSGRNWNGGSGSGGGGNGNGSGRNWNGGGGGGRNWNGGGGSGSNWNGGGCGNQRNQDEGQHQQRNSSGMMRIQDEGRHQMRSGGLQQQGQRGRKMEWRPVQHNRVPKDDPAA